MLGSLNGLTRVLTGGLGMLPGLCAALNLLIQFGIFNGALQQPGARDQYGIVFLFAYGVGQSSLLAGIVQVANIEIEQSTVFINAANAVMVIVMPVDFFRLLQISKRLHTQLFIGFALPLLLTTSSRDIAALAAARGLRINLFADLRCHQALDIGNIIKRAGQVAVLRVPLLIVLNGFGEELQGFVVASLPADHASMRGINVAQRDVIIGMPQYLLGLIEHAGALPQMPLLKQPPAPQHPH